MKVLIATTLTQGHHPGDYGWALDGELVYPPTADCGQAECGCGRSLLGMASASSTTTAVVVERPDLSAEDLSLALIDSLSRQGWLDDGWTAANEALVDTIWDRLTQAAEYFDDGTIVERRGDVIRARATAVPAERAA